MEQAEFFACDAPALGPGDQRVQLECPHGRTYGLLLAGSKPVADQVVLDLLRVRHGTENECHCTAVLRPGMTKFGAGADGRVLPALSHRPIATAFERSDA
jgi:hypothetical protein